MTEAEKVPEPLVDDQPENLKAALEKANAQLQAELAERKEAEARLRCAHEYIQQLISAANVMIIGLDALGRVRIFNKAAERITGYTIEELTGIDWFARIVPRDRYAHVWEMFRNYQEKTGAMPATFEKPILTKAGEERFIAWQNATISSPDKEIVTISFGMDITERRRAAAELEKSMEVVEKIFSMATTCIAYMDRNFNFIRVNAKYAEADDKTPEYFPGKNHFDLYPNEENKAIFQRVVETGEQHIAHAKPFEYKEHPERGVTHWDWSLTPVKDSQGTVASLILSVVDVTDRVKAHEELHRLNEELEQRVNARTAELAAKNEELERLIRLFVGRELRMVELKEKINKLEGRR